MIRIETNISDLNISKQYHEQDQIWKKEPEKRVRQMLADVRQEIEGKFTFWTSDDGNGTICIKTETLPHNLNSSDGCRAFSDLVLSKIIQHCDEQVKHQMTTRG